MGTPHRHASLSVLALLAALASPPAAQGQFDSPPANYRPFPQSVQSPDAAQAPLPPIEVGQFDTLRSEWVNFETQLIKPILYTQSDHVVVANEPNGTLDVYSADLVLERRLVLGHGIASLAERVTKGAHELWVSVRHQQAVAVVRVADWKLTHWLRAPIADGDVGYGAADHPGQVAFSADQGKAYVTSFHADSLVVFDADAPDKDYLGTIALERDHNGADAPLNAPYSLTAVGDALYVVSHLSGNQTLPLSRAGIFEQGTPQGGPALPPPGEETAPAGSSQVPGDHVAVVDLRNIPQVVLNEFPGVATWTLPDFDVVVVDTTNDQVVDHVSEVGTINFNIVHHPGTNSLWVTNLASRNGEFIGEESWPEGRVVHNRITRISLATGGGVSYDVTEGLLADPALSVAQPADLTVDAAGRVWVCGYGSANLGVYNATGALAAVIETDAGPRGVAAAPDGAVYVLSRGHNRVLRYDASGTLPTSADLAVDLLDPTPEGVKAGRRRFISSEFSGAGTTSCNSCHVDARKDGLGWDLSDFHNEGDSFTLDEPPYYWNDRKGVMVTQDLRGLPEVSPFHWRGENHDLAAFNGAFEGLLHGERMNAQEFREFQEFVFSTVYPANPTQQLNRTFTSTADYYLDDERIIAEGSPGGCLRCHAEPFGTNNDQPFLATPGEDPLGRPFVRFAPLPAQLRGLPFKEAGLANLTPGANPTTSTGFGLLHNGIENDIDAAALMFPLTLDLIDPVQAIMHEFDTGVAPAAHYSELLHAGTLPQSRLDFMVEQAELENCDLAGRGHLELYGIIDQDVGVYWDRASDRFVPDDSALSPWTQADLEYLVEHGNLEILMLGVPVGSGRRVGVDMDRDGYFDMAELRAGLDPTRPDSDGDGLWDGYDPAPEKPSAAPAGHVGVSDLRVVAVTTSTVKLTWETDALSPTAVLYGASGSLDRVAGDPFPVPLNPNSSRNWRRVHGAVLQLLPAERDIRFSILTQGQNGAVYQSPQHVVSTDPDNLNLRPRPQIQSDWMTISSQEGGGAATWTASVRITDADGIPLPNVNVRGFFVHFQGGAPEAQERVGPAVTNAQGIATLSSTHSGQVSGDHTEFVLPALMQDAAGTWILPVSSVDADANGELTREFAWPESTVRSIEGVLP